MSFKSDKYKLTLNFSEIVKGSDVALRARIDKVLANCPLPLAGFVGATAYFPAADTTENDDVAVTGTSSAEQQPLGEISFPVTDEQSALIAAGELQSIEVEVEADFGTIVVQLEEGLTVRDRLFQST